MTQDKFNAALKPRVFVAMSGGVDSSVAAGLLKRRGFEPIGVFMKFWSDSGKSADTWNKCCSLESQKRATMVAQMLNIPFYVLNMEREFKKRVVNYFLKEHRAGRTPNPCVVCNKEIKFGLLLEKALAMGADFLATGHYARKRDFKFQTFVPSSGRGISNFKFKSLNLKTHKLLRAKDKKKDQSYFLWGLNQKQLKHILFPVGNYTKKQVKELAKKMKLPVLKIPESQEICFVKTSVQDFLLKHLRLKPGLITDTKGRVIGQHQGLPLYTIGQRKGLGLSKGPWYISEKNLKTNTLIIAKNKNETAKKELIAKNANWISGKPPQLPIRIQTKIRSNSPLVPAIIKKGMSRSSYRVIFDKKQPAITPGQSVVFYLPVSNRNTNSNTKELLGGGIISG